MKVDISWVRVSAIMGLMGVGLGAAGAHGRIHDVVEATGHLDDWATAVDYHLLHTVVLLLIAALGSGLSRFFRLAWRLIFFGVVFFSGSLYLMGLTGKGWLGAVTPIGGLCLMAGWLCLALGAGKGRLRPSEGEGRED